MTQCIYRRKASERMLGNKSHLPPALAHRHNPVCAVSPPSTLRVCIMNKTVRPAPRLSAFPSPHPLQLEPNREAVLWSCNNSWCTWNSAPLRLRRNTTAFQTQNGLPGNPCAITGSSWLAAKLPLTHWRLPALLGSSQGLPQSRPLAEGSASLAGMPSPPQFQLMHLVCIAYFKKGNISLITFQAINVQFLGKIRLRCIAWKEGWLVAKQSGCF